MKIEERIDRIRTMKRASKRSNDEFAIFSLSNGLWRVALGNGGSPVMLGESTGEIEVEGASIDKCLAKLERKLKIA